MCGDPQLIIDPKDNWPTFPFHSGLLNPGVKCEVETDLARESGNSHEVNVTAFHTEGREFESSIHRPTSH